MKFLPLVEIFELFLHFSPYFFFFSNLYFYSNLRPLKCRIIAAETTIANC